MGNRPDLQAGSGSRTLQNVPYTHKIPAGLQEGMIMIVCGRVLRDANRFQVDLMHRDDVVLHVNPRYENGREYVVHNTFRNGHWDPNYEQDYECPFPRGQSFALQILVTRETYKIRANGKHLSEYTHRIPFSHVDSICVGGMVEVNLVDIQYHEPLRAPVPGPFNVPYTHKIPAGLQEGMIMIVCGRVLRDANRFQVDLQHCSDIVLHVNPRYENGREYVVHNTFRNGHWDPNYEQDYECPFPRGQSFALQILVTHESYKIRANGKHLSEYKHRIPFSHVDSICVGGMVEVNLVDIQYHEIRANGKHFSEYPQPCVVDAMPAPLSYTKAQC